MGVFYFLFSYCLVELFSINTYVSLTQILTTHASLLESVCVTTRSSLSYAGRYVRRLQKYLLPYDWQHGQRCCNPASRFVTVIKMRITHCYSQIFRFVTNPSWLSRRVHRNPPYVKESNTKHQTASKLHQNLKTRSQYHQAVILLKTII